MIVDDSAIKELLLHNTVDREIVIHFPNDNISDITDSHIISESMSLKRSIMGKEFKFGGGIASQFKIKVIGIEIDLTDKNIEVSLRQTVRPLLYPSQNLFPSDNLYPCGRTQMYEWRIFTGKINSALRQKNRAIKEIIAFDDLSFNYGYIYEYMTGLASFSPQTSLQTLRFTVEERLNHSENENLTLFNDTNKLSLELENVKKVIQPKKTNSTDLLKAYAELNAAFLAMDRFNKIKYIQLISPKTERIPCYKNLDWQEYITAGITGLRFYYNQSNSKKYWYGYPDAQPKSEYVSNNLLTGCCTDINDIIQALGDYTLRSEDNRFNAYRPYKAVLFDYWWLEPGDKVVIDSGAADTPTVSSYVFSVTLSGIKNISVTINAEGEQYLGKGEFEYGD